jgi:enoyl-CoA hydratase/carnithine racemase
LSETSPRPPIAPPALDRSKAADKAGSKLLLRERRDDVYILTMNHQDSRNALSEAMISELDRALVVVKVWLEVKAVVITASGPVFSSGHDLKDIKTHLEEDGDGGKGHFKKMLTQCTRLMNTLTTYPKPIIAAVQGTAMAAGVQLVASCDLAVAADTAKFCTPGVNIGFFCSTPSVALSRTIARKHAMEMLLTGEMLEAQRALEFGLVNRVVPAHKVVDEAVAFGQIIGRRSPMALAKGKELFYAQADKPTDAAYDTAIAAMIEGMMSEDGREGVAAFLGKREPEWKLGD